MARQIVFAALTLISIGLICLGVAGFSMPAAAIVGGILLAAWSWLILAEVGE